MNPELEKIWMAVQKPGRYTGGELNSVVKNKNEVDVRFAFCFPDTYEVGMSHLGMKILYGQFNAIPWVWCERVFAPWVDMEEQMRTYNIPLYGLESGDPIAQFDFIGFTLQYELSYTNVLNMLDLAGIPIRAEDRPGLHNIVVAGGPCACNPEPLADFIDLFFIGEGEEVDLEVLELYRTCKRQGLSKAEFLRAAAQIQGVYVPSLYTVDYKEDGTIASVTPRDGAPEKVTKRLIMDLDKVYYPESFVVPSIEIVHDRVMEEIFRGCIRGCRFCQAGFLYRPVREKSPEVIDRQSRCLCGSTGYDEVSLSSLSSSDYSKIQELLSMMLEWSEEERVSLSLPSLRVDGFSDELRDKLNTVRRSGLTFAPEAGTQRLRDAINKNVTEEEMLNTAEKAFCGGWTAVKLYFMIGLPTETIEDVQGIAGLAQRVVDTYYACLSRPKGKSVKVTVSTASFVPKPFTPFQWEPQDSIEMLHQKQLSLRESITSKKISYHWHDADTSFLEGVFARGDRRLGRVLEYAHKNGCRFDGWSDFFHLDQWMDAFAACGIDPHFYANRRRPFEEILPWDHIDYGIHKEFLIRECQKAYQSVTTPNCREACSHCGASCWKGGVCTEKR
jgi:radical SAM family uncharacterized protein